MSLVLAAKKHIFSIDSNMRSIRGVCIFFSLFTLSFFWNGSISTSNTPVLNISLFWSHSFRLVSNPMEPATFLTGCNYSNSFACVTSDILLTH